MFFTWSQRLKRFRGRLIWSSAVKEGKVQRLVGFLKTIKRANKCDDFVTFQKVKHGYLTDIVTYNSSMVWTNSDLLRMQENGYELKPND